MPANKGFSVLVLDRVDSLAEAGNHIFDSSTYKEVKFVEEELVKYVEQSNRMFNNLFQKKIYYLKNKNISAMVSKKQPILEKCIFLEKIHKRREEVLGFLVVANCGLPT